MQILELMEEKGRLKNILPRGILISNNYPPKKTKNLIQNIIPNFPINCIITQTSPDTFPKFPKKFPQVSFVFCDFSSSGDGNFRTKKKSKKIKRFQKNWDLLRIFENHRKQINPY